MTTRRGRLTTSLRSVVTPRYVDGENYIDITGADSSGNNNALGWFRYKDAAAARPVDGIGGSPTLVDNVSTTTVQPLSNGHSLVLNKLSGNAQGEGWAVDFRIDRALLASVVSIEFDYILNSGTFVAGSTQDSTTAGDSSLIVYIYDVDNNVLIEPSTFRIFSNSTNIPDKYAGYFQTSADGLNYRLILHVARTETAAWQLKIDNVFVGKKRHTYGTIITDWTDFPSVAAGTLITATTTNPTYGTVAYNRAQWRRVGSEMEIRWIFRQTTAGTAGSGAYLFNLPPGFQIDLNKLNPSLSSTGTSFSDFFPSSCGFICELRASDRASIGYASIYDSTRLKFIYLSNYSGGSPSASAVSANSGHNIFNSSPLSISLSASVPIVGWSSSVKISEPMETRNVACTVKRTTNLSYSTTPVKVGFDLIQQDTSYAWDTTNNEFVAPTSATYLAVFNAQINSMSSTSRLYIYINGSSVRRLSNASAGHNLVAILNLTSGDRVSAYIDSDTSNTLLGVSPSDTFFQIIKLPSSQHIAQSEICTGYAYKTTSQSIPNNTLTTVLDFVKEQDTHNALNASNGILTSPKSGYLTLNAGTLFAASSSGDIREIVVKVNSTVVARNTVARRSDNTANPTVSITGVRVNTGDQIVVQVLQNSGAALNIQGVTDRYNYISWKIE